MKTRKIGIHGRSNKRRRPLAAEEAAHRIDVAAALQRLGRSRSRARHVDRDAMRHRGDIPVEPRPDPHQHLRADHVEAALEDVKSDRRAPRVQNSVGMLPLVRARS